MPQSREAEAAAFCGKLREMSPFHKHDLLLSLRQFFGHNGLLDILAEMNAHHFAWLDDLEMDRPNFESAGGVPIGE